MTISTATQVVMEYGNIAAESIGAYNDAATGAPGSPETAAALLSTAGVITGIISNIDNPFTSALSTSLGISAGVLGVVINGIQLAKSIENYKNSIGTAGESAALSDLADKVFSTAAGIGGAIAAVPGLQPLGLAIWTGASIGKNITNGNFGGLPGAFEDFLETIRKILIPGYALDKAINDAWREANTWTSRDPLAIDLDGDGIETVALSPTAPITFDHNADGTKTGTGWLKGDDAWLVLDRDSNGTIDSGRELFGVDTQITVNGATRYATNGFEALTTLDANGDKVFDAKDAAFAQVRLWQDLNQDGISQAGELTTLANKSITAISLNYTAVNINLGNGNTVSGMASVTRGGVASEIDSVVIGGDTSANNLDLAENPFYREFTDPIVTTSSIQTLPNMRGAGLVRDLRDAMSLSADANASFITNALMKSAAQDLTSTVTAFAAAKTRDTQLALIDQLIQQWGRTSSAETTGTTFSTTTAGDTRYMSVQTFAEANPDLYKKIIALEQFNGTTGLARWVTNSAVTVPTAVVNLFNKAYDALRTSVYRSLATQTRLSKYIEEVKSNIDATGIKFDTSTLSTKLDEYKTIDAKNAFIDLIELNKYSQQTLTAVGFDGLTKLSNWLSLLPADSPIRSEFEPLRLYLNTNSTGSNQDDVYLGSDLSNSFNAGLGDDVLNGAGGADDLKGNEGNDVINGGADNDALYGGAGSDTINGGTGNDALHGGAGSDTINGGTGNDSLYGDAGADSYIFGKGSGQDTLNNYDSDVVGTNIDSILLGTGITTSNLKLSRQTDDLIISLIDTDDSLRVQNYFTTDGASTFVVENIKFADNTVWDVNTIKTKLITGTVGNDTLYGYASDDAIVAIEGADAIYGEAGNDKLDGGSSDDVVNGGDGNDTLEGGSGIDSLFGGAGSDILDGGLDADYLYGGGGADTYRFGRGSGQDQISNSDLDTVGVNSDTILLGSGIAPTDISITRSGNTLILTIEDTNESLRVVNYFSSDASESYVIENIKFADNTIWDIATVKAKVLQPTTGNDIQHGYASNDTITGGDGNDLMYGNAGDDSIEGGTGADSILGGEGLDAIRGGIGKDTLSGGNGNDSLFGNEHDDTLYGDAGNDTLDGGSGNDNMQGGAGADIYLFGRGYGQDTIGNSDTDAVGVNTDTILLGTGITADDLSFTRTADDLTIRINGTADSLRVQNYFRSEGSSQNVIENLKFADNTVWNVATIKTKVLIATIDNDTIVGYTSNDSINGDDGQDQVDGYAGDDAIDGGRGLDTLSGGEGNDSLTGGAHDDILMGDSGNDTLDGGQGNDYLHGDTGSDTYLFGRGSGQDEINNAVFNANATDIDTILLGAGVSPDDVTLTRSTYDGTRGRHDDDLVISINGTDDALTVLSYFRINPGSDYVVHQIKFANNTVWDLTTVKSKVSIPTSDYDSLYGYSSNDTINGGDGNDLIYGYAGDDVIEGGMGADEIIGGDDHDVLLGNNGNDTLYGGAGTDTLDGGPGNDYLRGNAGADTYLFGKGSGNDRVSNIDLDAVGINKDTVELGAYINSANILLTRSGDDLIISINGTDDSLRVEYYFSSDGTSSYVVENLKFADNIVWDYATVKSKLSTPSPVSGSVVSGNATSESLIGGVGNDTINGNAGNDTLDGGAGNDTLNGGSGNDTYVFGKGAGKDTINAYDSTAGKLEAIRLSSEVLTTDVTLKRDVDALLLTISSTNDSLRINSYFANDGTGGYQIEQLKFADNTIWDLGAIKNKVLTATTDNDTLIGYASADSISGSSGDDSISGRNGNDTLDGGAGRDTLNGEGGNDSIQGGSQIDVIYGGIGSDILLGQDGDDYLSGDADNDTLNGGLGNDLLKGCAGSDTYQFGKGFGKDTISAGVEDVDVNRDVIELSPGVLTTDVVLTRKIDDLVLSINGTNDSLRITSYFDKDVTYSYLVEKIKFADNTVWDINTIKNKVLTASNEPDYLDGYDTADSLSGLAGADAITGDSGDDTLDGGAGKDILYGGTGNDSLLGGEQGDYLIGDAGTDTLLGQDGDDVLFGYADDDTLDGGAGNDKLDGGLGNDTYLFSKGSGNDTISAYDSSAGKLDIIQLGAGLLSTDVVLQRDGDALVLSIKNATDSLRVNSYFATEAAGGYQIEQIKFSDNSSWDINAIKKKVLIYSSENDTLPGFATDDDLSGLSGDDSILGQAGNDTIDGGAGLDSLYGGIGDDSILGGTQNDTLDGGAGKDALQGQDGDDSVNGAADDDKLSGGLGNDSLNGDSGNDILAGDAGNDSLSGGVGTSSQTVSSIVIYARGTLLGGIGPTMEIWIDGTKVQTFTVNSTEVGAYTVTAPLGMNAKTIDIAFTNDASAGPEDRNLYVEKIVVSGNEIMGNAVGVVTDYGSGTGAFDWINVYRGNGGIRSNGSMRFGLGENDYLDGGTGNDNMTGGMGNDVYIVDSATDDVTELNNEGYDFVESSVTYTLANNLEHLTLKGTANIDGSGNSLNNMLVGNNGANVLDGLAGADFMVGYDGNDTYIVDNSGDVCYENVGQGTDSVQASVSHNLAANLENLTLTGSSSINGKGNGLANNLSGNTASNALDGGAGDDTLYGGAGSDGQQVSSLVIHARGTLVAGEGPTMEVWIDGTKVQTFAVNSTTVSAYTVTAPLGMNAKSIDIAFSNDARVGSEDRNLFIEKIVVSGNEIMGNAVGVITDYGNGTGAFDWSNVYRANGGIGGNGAMRFGLGDNDYLNGGTGSDNMAGDLGNDVYIVDSATDTVIELANEGFDFVESSVTHTLAANIEHLTLTGTANINGTGNGLNNMLVGNNGANVLNGRAGADFMVGYNGNDTYVVDNSGDVCYENAEQGIDSVQASVSHNLAANVENLTLTGSEMINGGGNSLANQLSGNVANNTLNGGAGNDTLNGGDGNDVLNGGTGTSSQTVSTLVIHARGTLIAGVGPTMEVWIDGTKVQTFAVNSTTVSAYTVTAPLGMNAKSIDIAFTNDAIVGSEDRNLFVEKIVVSGKEIMGNAVGVVTDYGSGSGAFDWINVYRGNGGIGSNGAMRFGLGENDYLNGGAGNDNMTGGMGNDVYIVDSATDVVTELTNEGYDFVESSVSHTLAANLEHLTLTGAANVNGTGNALNNMLVGNNGANVLNGQAGADFMVGYNGNDTFVVDSSGDVCYENAGQGTDTVQSSISYTLAANVENLTLSGATAINGTGNSLANELTGNSANNVLSGGQGNDVYRGGAGADTLNDNDTTSADRYIWGRNEGADTLTDAGGSDQLDVLAGVSAEQLWLQKSGNHLVLSVIGTSDRVTINNWYANAANQVELFKLSDGKSLTNTKVDNLVNAMASFTPPAAGQTTLPPDYQTSLSSVIAANWQ